MATGITSHFVLSAPLGTVPTGATGQLTHIDSCHVALTFDKHPGEDLVLDVYDTDPEVWGAIARATPRNRWKLSPRQCYRMAAVVAAAIAATLGANGSLTATPPPPVVYANWSMAKDPIKVGAPLAINTHYNRNRACQTSFDRTVVRVDDGTIVFTQRYYGSLSKTTNGFGDVVVSTDMPNLKPGNYAYTGSTHSECALGGTYDTPHPPLRFTVVE